MEMPGLPAFCDSSKKNEKAHYTIDVKSTLMQVIIWTSVEQGATWHHQDTLDNSMLN